MPKSKIVKCKIFVLCDARHRAYEKKIEEVSCKSVTTTLNTFGTPTMSLKFLEFGK